MKFICKVDTAKKKKGFQEYKVILKLKPENMVEVNVTVEGYDESRISISSGGVAFNPKDLTVSCNYVGVTCLLLHVELCKRVMELYPELREWRP